MSGNRQFFLSMILLMLVPAAARARDVPLNGLGTSAGQAQRRADGTILLRPGATVRTDFAVRDGHGVTAQVERRDRCSTNLQVTARLREARDVFERTITLYHTLHNLDGGARAGVHLAWLLTDNDEPEEGIAVVRPLLPALDRKSVV